MAMVTAVCGGGGKQASVRRGKVWSPVSRLLARGDPRQWEGDPRLATEKLVLVLEAKEKRCAVWRGGAEEAVHPGGR